MRIKLLAAVIALLSMGVAFSFTPFANADTSSEEHEMEMVGPSVTSLVQRGSTLKLEWGNQGENVEYLLYRSDNGGPFEYRWTTQNRSAADHTTKGEVAFHVKAVKMVDGAKLTTNPGKSKSITTTDFDVKQPELSFSGIAEDGSIVVHHTDTGQAKMDVFINDEYIHTFNLTPGQGGDFAVPNPGDDTYVLSSMAYTRGDSGLLASAKSNKLEINGKAIYEAFGVTE